MELLNAEQAERQAELSLVQAQASPFSDTAALFQALGGGRSPKFSPAQKREILDMLAVGRWAADLARLFRVHRATISRLVEKTARSPASNPDDGP